MSEWHAVDLGRIVFDSAVFPIRRIYLADGKTHYAGVLWGPVPALEYGTYGVTVYAPDDSVVVSALTTAGWAEVGSMNTITYDLPVSHEWDGWVAGRDGSRV